jgi:hypothetical protein
MINIEFKPRIGGHPKQEIVWSSEAKEITLLWGRRCGKDWIASKKAIKNTYQDFQSGKHQNPNPSLKNKVPRLHYWALAPTYSLSKVQIAYFLSYLDPRLLQRPFNWGSNELWLYPEILWEFKSAHIPDNLVATGLNGGYITETARLKPTVYNDNFRPCLSDKQGWCIDTTTPTGALWFVQQIWNQTIPTSDNYNPDRLGIHAVTAENTCVDGLVEEVEKQRKVMPHKYFVRNYEAKLDAFFGQIYDDFQEDIHVQEFDFIRERYKVIIGGQDWGYTHKGVLITIGITNDDSVDVIAEVAKSKLPVCKPSDDYVGETWISEAKAQNEIYGYEMIYAGPDEPEHIDAYQCAGLYCDKANNSVTPGILFVSTIMKVDENNKSRLRIHPSCKNLIENMKYQKWKQDPSGEDSEVPEKINDDSNDALRYALYSAKHWFDLSLNIA